jgi:hypothetical protein
LDEEGFAALVTFVFAGGDEVADDAAEEHG